MPRTEEKVKCLGTKKFSNRNYSIRITFYDHGMAEAHYDDKLIHRHCYLVYYGLLIFDSCTVESMYDFQRSLRELRFSKVAQRWFRRQLRHCTKGLMKPDGNPDFEKVYERQNMLNHISENKLPWVEGRDHYFLSESELRTLLDICHKANCNEETCRVFIKKMEEPSEKAPENRKNYIYLPNGEILSIIQKVLPDFYETVKHDRKLDNCTASIGLDWTGPTTCDMHAIVQDNDYVDYVIWQHGL